MKFIDLISASTGFLLLLCSCSLTQKSDRDSMSEIYSDVMAYEFSYGHRGYLDYCENDNMIVSSLTDDYSVRMGWETASIDFPKLEKETWDNFVEVNAKQIPFPADLELGCKYTLLDVEIDPPGWSRENCVSVEYFSQIGFNSRKNQAVVWRSASCGDFAFGNTYFAELIDGHWIVTEISEGFIT